MDWSKNRMLRKLLIPIMKKINPGTIKIKHQFTGLPFFLHSFKHKGYWYHGKNREKNSMTLFSHIINTSNMVIEVGGHIGYLSTYFSMLVGSKGNVIVFEPGENNLLYLKKNVGELKNVTIVAKAVSDRNGEASFYVEDFSGQNNSLLPTYDGLQRNTENAYVTGQKKEVIVSTVALDNFCFENDIIPDFIKIDIEGAELIALQGMRRVLLEIIPILMIEVTENFADVIRVIHSYDYLTYSDLFVELNSTSTYFGNVFCFHKEKHQKVVLELSQKKKVTSN